MTKIKITNSHKKEKKKEASRKHSKTFLPANKTKPRQSPNTKLLQTVNRKARQPARLAGNTDNDKKKTTTATSSITTRAVRIEILKPKSRRCQSQEAAWLAGSARQAAI